MNSKIYICSFANLYLLPALKRFYNQAIEMNIFEDIFLYEELNLGKDFTNHFNDKLNYNVRGFGYWCWKPYIILKSLEKIKDGDILVYADTGCHLKKEYIDKMKNYIEYAEKYDIVAFELSIPDKFYTKSDLFNYFNVLNNKEITDTNTRCATSFVIKKTDKTIRFVNEWLKIFYYNFNLADDTPSVIKNLDGFVEHRHDQSIFSILSKLYNAKAITNFEDGKEPINFSRDKRGMYSDIIYKITWLIPFKNLRWKLKNILFNKFNNVFYKRLKKLSNSK